MTGLHLLHLVIGTIILCIAWAKIRLGLIHEEHYVLLENGALYWHLVEPDLDLFVSIVILRHLIFDWKKFIKF